MTSGTTSSRAPRAARRQALGHLLCDRRVFVERCLPFGGGLSLGGGFCLAGRFPLSGGLSLDRALSLNRSLALNGALSLNEGLPLNLFVGLLGLDRRVDCDLDCVWVLRNVHGHGSGCRGLADEHKGGRRSKQAGAAEPGQRPSVAHGAAIFHSSKWLIKVNHVRVTWPVRYCPPCQCLLRAPQGHEQEPCRRADKRR